MPDAIQEQGSASMDVRQQASHGEEVAEGNGETEAASTQEKTLVLSAHRGNDTGGTGWRLAQAFGPDQLWAFRSACNPTSVLPYLDYPVDVPWHWETIRQLHAESDLFHARNDFSTYSALNSRLPLVIHYHGTNFRHLWATRLREQKLRKAIGLVSTLDLWLIRPDELEWIPSPYDLAWLRSLSSR